MVNPKTKPPVTSRSLAITSRTSYYSQFNSLKMNSLVVFYQWKKSLLNPDVWSSSTEAHFHPACDPNKSETHGSGSQGQVSLRGDSAISDAFPQPAFLLEVSKVLQVNLQFGRLFLSFFFSSCITHVHLNIVQGLQKEGAITQLQFESCI